MINPIPLIEQLTALALIVQSVEMLQLQRTMADDGPWSWKIIRDDFQGFPSGLRWLLDHILAFPGLALLLWMQILCALALLVTSHPMLNCFLLTSTVLICLRWRGTFNGGSDYMTVLILAALTVARLSPHHPQILVGCLWYIALQLCASYFIAGVVKLRNIRWRDGSALPAIFELPQYSAPKLSQRLRGSPRMSFALCWGTMLFECAFPVALLHPQASLALMTIAFVFHLGNAFQLGLNRFLFIWPAAYPALYFCSAL